MALTNASMFADISADDEIEVIDHMVYRNGKRIPYVPHDKLKGRDKIDVKYFVYHFSSGRPSLDGLLAYLKAESTQADVHLCLDRAGRLVQMAPLNTKAWHAGSSAYNGLTGMNSYSCGIEVINPGPLDILGGGKYKSWFGEVYTSEPDKGILIEEAVHPLRKGAKMGWMHYSPAQIQITTSLAIAIHAAYGAQIVGHDEITDRKSDPGPFSRIDRMRAMLASDRMDDEAPPPPVAPPVAPPVVTPPVKAPVISDEDEINFNPNSRKLATVRKRK